LASSRAVVVESGCWDALLKAGHLYSSCEKRLCIVIHPPWVISVEDINFLNLCQRKTEG
jgi:hypothetical protein